MAYKKETQLIRNQLKRSEFKEHSVPLYLTSSFIFDDAEDMRASFAEEKEAHLYSRFSNPNVSEFVDKMVMMEGAEAGFGFASGMGAVFSSMAALLNAGDHIVSSASIFGSTHSVFKKYFPKWGIETSYFNVNEPNSIEDLITPQTKLIYAESPTNPSLDLVDLEYLAKLAKKHNLIFLVDNCFATPYLQNPIDFGADLVIHSATKLLDGQGRVLGGVVVGREDLIREIYLFARNTGPALSPFNAWVLSKSLETLPIRVEKQSKNALEIAKYLETIDEIDQVKYLFLDSHPQHDLAKKQMKMGGNIVVFTLKGGLEAGRQFLDAIQLCSLTANLGDSRSIVTHPASTTHSKLSTDERLAVGITDGLIRLSVGLEHPDDVKEDLRQAIQL